MLYELYDKYEKKFPVLMRSLANARRTSRMAHAYLVYGDNHNMREEFAVLLVMIRYCLNPDNGCPCGGCGVCDRLRRGVYPELHTLRPGGKMRFIRVGDRVNPDVNTLRWFEALFHLTVNSAFSGKAGIIHDADRMNSEAQNAFLKTLEEPPPDTFFVLTTGNPSSLLPTTRSRCQSLMILENRTSFDFSGCPELIKALSVLAAAARGSLVRAEHCAAEVIRIAGTLKSQAEAAAAGEWGERLEAAGEMEPAGRKRVEEQYQAAASAEYLRLRNIFLGAIHTFFAQLYLLAGGADQNHLANPEFLEGVDMSRLPDGEFAAAAAGFAEELIYNCRFNVREELALRTFCLNVAFAGGSAG